MPLDLTRLLRSLPPEAVGPVLRVIRTGSPIADTLIQVGVSKLLQTGQSGSPSEKYGATPQQFLAQLLAAESGLFFINGPPGSGKTAFACWLAQEIERPTYIVNAPVHLPWMRSLSPRDLDTVPGDSVIIVDDAGQVASSRDYGTRVAQQVIDLAITRRHSDLVVITNTTATTLVNKYLMQAEATFWKRPWAEAEIIERQGMQRWLRQVEQAFDGLGLTADQEHGVIYARSSRFRFRGFVHYSLPDGYTEAVSKNKAGRRGGGGGARGRDRVINARETEEET